MPSLPAGIPANARDMHQRLVDLGVVGIVEKILRRDRSVLTATDILCWVEREGANFYVKVAYTLTRQPMPGRKAAPQSDRASFLVEKGTSFGPIGSQPLPDNLVTAIKATLSA